MSLCTAIRRALARSHISPASSLLPFLYQTATLQQWQPATRSIGRRNAASRPNARGGKSFGAAAGDPHVPFEDAGGNLPPVLDAAQPQRESTMTATERAAFEKLYKTFNTEGQGRSEGRDEEHDELDQIADEYYEDDEDTSATSLDKAFDTVLKGALVPQGAQAGVQTSHGGNVSTLPASEKAAVPDTPQNKKQAAAKAEKDRIKKLHMDERMRVDKMVQSAQTDQQLWQTLEHEVFDQLRKLNLDAPAASNKASQTNKSSDPTQTAPDSAATHDRLPLANFPYHLHTAAKKLRTHFPSSPLPFTILSTLKSLGRSSYALGATTHLYRQLLRAASIQQSSYSLIDTLLTDMDTNIIEFDARILDLLDSIIKEHDLAIGGSLGRELQMVYRMEMWQEGIKKIKDWRHVVAERLGMHEVKPRAVRSSPPRVERERAGIYWKRVPASMDRERVGIHQKASGIPPVGYDDPTGKAVVTEEIPFVNVPLNDGDLRNGPVSQEADAGEASKKGQENEGPDHDAEVPVKVML